MKVWFTSDLHLDHANIIKYCNRPFRHVDEMNRTIIDNWNATVAAEDLVFLLGDIAFCKRDKLPWFRSQLAGTIHVVKGNHDRGAEALEACGFEQISHELIAGVEGRLLYLRHIPNLEWRKEHPRAEIHLCGHVHNEWKRQGLIHRIINVGVDQWGFTPRSLEELLSG